MAKTHETREQLITQAIKDQQIEPFLKAIPYARFIEFDLHSDEKRRVFKLKQAEHNLGNPLLPAIHGGVIGGFMELAAGCHLILSQSTPTFPKVINFSLDYLRPAQLTETYASCEVSRQGGRVANVLIKSWQSSEDKPIALARAHFLLDENRSL
ncbi:MAG: PaaI family thioesterase [Pseudomonadota bacterium]